MFHTCKGAFEAGASWVAAASVIENYRVSGRWLREGRTQVDSRRDASKNLIWLITSVNESCGHAHLGILFVELEVVGLLLEKSDLLGVACVPLRGGTGGFSG